MMIGTGYYNVCTLTIAVLHWHTCMMTSTALSRMYDGRHWVLSRMYNDDCCTVLAHMYDDEYCIVTYV